MPLSALIHTNNDQPQKSTFLNSHLKLSSKDFSSDSAGAH